ncbi:rCG64256 [Rattus norvegicus]|uniref:RCG64256 n=1 Tax=Rattus norvegicus TaxID=10116 RepID=A6KF08_RAT|nr:rCG64256 [Rattus norvegicus]
MGKAVSKAVEHINNSIAPALVSKKLNDVEEEKIDQVLIEMDGIENKSKFGANAILKCHCLSAKLVLWKRGCPFTITLLTWPATLKSSCQFQLSMRSSTVPTQATSWPCKKST